MPSIIQLSGQITLRSSLAHGGGMSGSTVIPFRREPVLQRDGQGNVVTDPYAIAISNPEQREALRQYAQRLLRIVWQSKSDLYRWSYAQLADRVAISCRTTQTLADMVNDVIAHMGGTHPVLRDDDAEYLDRLLSAGDSGSLLALLRQPGERMLIVARMQAESNAKYEKRELPPSGQMTLFGAPAERPVGGFSPRHRPFIPEVPVYSANALRNGVVRRHAARFILDRFGWKLPLDDFRALFVGGALVRTGEKGINVSDRRAMTGLMPLYGLLGGPFNRSDMIEGSAKTGKCWPIVREAAPCLPVSLRDEAAKVAMQEIVSIEFATRREDAVLLGREYLADGVLTTDNNSMLYEREVLIPGTRLYTSWNLYAAHPLQLGAWVSAWVVWAQRPVLGGVSQQGHGLADVAYRTGDGEFLSVTDGEIVLADSAQRYFDAYCRHLDGNSAEIADFLHATTAQATAGAGVDSAELQAELDRTEGD